MKNEDRKKLLVPIWVMVIILAILTTHMIYNKEMYKKNPCEICEEKTKGLMKCVGTTEGVMLPNGVILPRNVMIEMGTPPYINESLP